MSRDEINPDVRLTRFFRAVQLSQEWSVDELFARMRGAAAAVARSTRHRLLNENEPAVWDANLIAVAIPVGAEAASVSTSRLADYLLLGKDEDRFFEKFQLAAHWLPDPRKVKKLKQLFDQYEDGASEMIWYQTYLPVSMMPDAMMRAHNKAVASQCAALGTAVEEAQNKFSAARRKAYVWNGGYGSATACVLIFESSQALSRPEFDPDDVCKCIKELIKEAIPKWNVQIGFVTDLHPQFPQLLREYFLKFDGIIGIDGKFVVRRPLGTFRREYFELGSDEHKNACVADDWRKLNELKRWVPTCFDPNETIKVLERLPR